MSRADNWRDSPVIAARVRRKIPGRRIISIRNGFRGVRHGGRRSFAFLRWRRRQSLRSRKSKITGIQVSADRVVPWRRREMVGSIPVEMLMSALCHIPVLLVPVHTHLHYSMIVSIDEREHAVAPSAPTLYHLYIYVYKRIRAYTRTYAYCTHVNTYNTCTHLQPLPCWRSTAIRTRIGRRATHRNASPRRFVLSSFGAGVCIWRRRILYSRRDSRNTRTDVGLASLAIAFQAVATETRNLDDLVENLATSRLLPSTLPASSLPFFILPIRLAYPFTGFR